MKIEHIKTPGDILEFFENNITYGWLDYNREPHIMTMKEYRKLYRTMSIEDTIRYGMGGVYRASSFDALFVQ